MVDLVSFTPSGSCVVKEEGAADDKYVIDAAGYRSLDLVLTALSVSGTFWLRMETALTLDAPAWQSLGLFTPLTEKLATDRRSFHGVLRYVRWKVEKLTGDSATFTLAGTAM